MIWESYNTSINQTKYLYKFLPEEYLLDFLNTGNIWFARSDLFGDKMECLMIDDVIRDSFDYSKIEERKKKHLITCFHTANNESLALWDTYAKADKDRRKYAIRFGRESFINLVKNATADAKVLPLRTHRLIHGNIKYKNLILSRSDRLTKQKVRYPSFRKEAAFSYEQEYRFAIKLSSPYTKKGITLNLGNPNHLQFKILINPLLEKDDFAGCIDKISNTDYGNSFKLSRLTKWFHPELWDL